MEQKLNIAEILKHKTENTKLYSRLFGNVYFYDVVDDLIKVTHHDGRVSVFFSDGRYYSYPESEPLLLPSKEMQDWSKFAWKKGDEKIGEEPGVSVYEAHKNINGTYSPVLPFPISEKALNSFIINIAYSTNNKYLVTGDLLDKIGTDGEPLIKNVKILMKL